MGKIKDLTGQRFGKLIVIKDSGQRKNRQVVWECKCDCGKITYVVGQALRTGHTKSCGCLQAERASSANSKNLLGQRFGKLLVIKRFGSDKDRKALWECKCDCGKICTKSTNDLLNSHVKSCGCSNSKGELQIRQLLNKYGYNFISQYQNSNLLSPTGNFLRIDFMLLDSFGNPIRAI